MNKKVDLNKKSQLKTKNQKSDDLNKKISLSEEGDKVEKVETANDADYFLCVRNLICAKLGSSMGSFRKSHQIKIWKAAIREQRSKK